MDMKYTNLGKVSLKISKIVAGCMAFGSKASWGKWIIEDEEVFSILKRAFDLGIKTFETANVYSNGQSEVLIGKFWKKCNIDRLKVVILSKLFYTVDESDPNFNPTHISNVQKYEYINRNGLSRTYIEVLQIHRLDTETPKEEIMGALHDVVKNNQTRHISASSMRAVEFAQLQFITEKNRWTKKNMKYINSAITQVVGSIPWSSLATGILARLPEESTKSVRGANNGFASFLGLETEADNKTIKRVKEIADKEDVSMAIVATAWIISKRANPIVGFNSVKRVEKAAAAVKFKLTEEIEHLEEFYLPKKLPVLFESS